MVRVKLLQRRTLMVTDVLSSWAEVIIRVKWQLEIQTNVVISWSASRLAAGREECMAIGEIATMHEPNKVYIILRGLKFKSI